VLARDPDPGADDVRRVERLVRTEILRMERLVEDLLVLARADEREFLRRRQVDLEPFCRELVEGFAASAERRFELGAVPAGTLDADPDRLAQALRNLMRNAIEQTAPGGLVRLSADATRDGGVVLAVEDDGPGIPADQRERVFDRFHRTDSARNRSRGGAGLGLAIVRAIVDAHGGRAAAGESPEGGARVQIELPGFTPGPGASRYAPAVSSSS
jgi:two-component system OmpR family sensor kinase